MRPALGFQLKATINLGKSQDEFLSFPLKIRNYNLLRINTQTPRLLVVLDLPTDENRWVTITEDELVLRHRAYWLNLKGYEEKENESSVTVHIPKKNLFNVDNLHTLMKQSRGGRIE